MIPVFTGEVLKGQLRNYFTVRFQNYLKTLEGQKVEIIVRKQKTKRSDNQNSYYWGVVLDILSRHTGYESDEMHEILKFKFLRKRISDDVEYVQSTTKLNTAEMEEYLEKIRRFAAMDLFCVIPLPNECEAA